MRRKLAIDPRQIEHRCNRTHLVIVRHHLFKAERIKQLSLILLQPTHHGPFPPLTASTSGNHCSRQPSTDFCNKICHNRTHASQQKVDGDLIMMRDYEPQSDAATRRMLASATDMAAALSFGCVFAGIIISALLSRLSCRGMS